MELITIIIVVGSLLGGLALGIAMSRSKVTRTRSHLDMERQYSEGLRVRLLKAEQARGRANSEREQDLRKAFDELFEADPRLDEAFPSYERQSRHGGFNFDRVKDQRDQRIAKALRHAEAREAKAKRQTENRVVSDTRKVLSGKAA